MININDLKKHIKKRKAKKLNMNFLGFVENQDLTPEVVSYFSFAYGYDWVNGNDKMKALVDSL